MQRTLASEFASTSAAHLRENLAAEDLELSTDMLRELDAVGENRRYTPEAG